MTPRCTRNAFGGIRSLGSCRVHEHAPCCGDGSDIIHFGEPAQDHVNGGGGVPLRQLCGCAWYHEVTRGRACDAVPSDLSAERLPARDTLLMHEGGPGSAILSLERRELAIGKCMDFVRGAQAVEIWTMNYPLHVLQDREFGDGRVLFHEMVLMKPPYIGSEYRWQQNAAYYSATDPGLIIGVWLAPDPTLRENGRMELVPGAQFDGIVSHGHKNDFNSYSIASQHARAAERIAIDLQTGDAPIVDALRYQYVSPNASKLHRHAVQYHYYYIDTVWGDVAERRRLFHLADDSHAGCTIPCEHVPPGGYIYRSGLERPIVPIGLLY